MLRNIDDASIFHRKVPKRAAPRSPCPHAPCPLSPAPAQIHSLRTCQRGKLEAMCPFRARTARFCRYQTQGILIPSAHPAIYYSLSVRVIKIYAGYATKL